MNPAFITACSGEHTSPSASCVIGSANGPQVVTPSALTSYSDGL
jgi:hypothetical protein